MALGRPLGAKLFLEGKEVPLIGATITCSVNQASIAYIDVVPHNAINDIKARTHVSLAVRDYNDQAGNYPYVSAWEGEVFGFSFGKQVGGRSFSISAIDTSSYWDNVLCYFMNTQQTLGSGSLDMLHVGMDQDTAKALDLRVTATFGSAASYFNTLIEGIMADSSKDFLDAFLEVYRNISDVNDFYNFAEKKLRIRDRMVLKSSQQLNDLLKGSAALDWFKGIINKSGGFQTLRGVVQDLLSIIFHDFTPIPFPGRVERSSLEGKKLASTDNKSRTIGNYVFKPNLYMIVPPVCNVFFPDEYSSFQYQRNFFKEPTRLIYKPELPFFNSGQALALPYTFEPDSFENYMLGKQPWVAFHNKGALGVTGDPGLYGDPDTSQYSKSDLKRKREAQFLTDEERIKGIWLAQEQMMPASTEFQTNIADPSRRDFCKKVSRYLFYKKRFENRALQITSHLKLSVVPGFNVLLLDDSEAQQNVVAYCSSVTHRIYATEGGYTNVTLSYARSVDEQQQTSTNAGEPLIPPWFSKEIFGEPSKQPVSLALDIKSLGDLIVTPEKKLSAFYATLLGDKGSKAVTDYVAKERTLVGAVEALLKEYRVRRSNGSEDLQAYISEITSRDYVKLRDAMDFIGSTTTAEKDLQEAVFAEFNDGAFSTSDPDFGGANTERLVPITLYRDALKTLRGFRG